MINTYDFHADCRQLLSAVKMFSGEVRKSELISLIQKETNAAYWLGIINAFIVTGHIAHDGKYLRFTSKGEALLTYLDYRENLG